MLDSVKLLGFCICFLAIMSSSTAQKGLQTILKEHDFVDTAGNKQSLKDIIDAEAGKVIYIDLWASWCVPCRKEFPYSLELQENLKDQPISFIYLSLDDGDAVWRKAMAKLNVEDKGQHYRRKRKEAMPLLQFFYIYSIPHYLIINKQGIPINRDALPPSDPRLMRQLRKWIKKK